MTPYPVKTLRILALHTQGLTTRYKAGNIPTLSSIYEIVEQLGCVQIDTLNLVQRSHYLVLWSRLGAYNPVDFDSLVYSNEHQLLFEGWQRIASIIPLKDYRYQMPHMDRLRHDPGDWYHRWLAQEGHNELLPLVLERIQQEGGLRAADFKYDGPKRGSWWDWKPAKVALEYQYAFGELMIADRVNFHRVYDLTERVLPAWVDTRPPTLEERDRYWVEQAALALGIGTPMQIIGYSYYKRNHLKPIVEALVSEGVLVPVEAELMNGKSITFLVHRDNLQMLQQASEGEICAERTSFLSPFDNLFWATGRDEQLWGFRQRLEAYLPAPKRTWGYFCLPILHKDRLVGRFDPKLERKTGVLRIKALYLEEGVEPDEGLMREVASAMLDFMTFHHARELEIEKSQPWEFGEKLLKAL
ncbi:MAG: hypothetical protein A2Y88_04080 [Chloroflexi bacterium RBG_13_48_10]|nr:MAG: hypothetical protein A2Y88_04080 [Chloroflexi bacterium RBG_13_48_10]